MPTESQSYNTYGATKNSQMILRNRTRLKPSHFLISMCFNTTIVKTVWYWHKKTHRPKNGEPKNKPIHMANKNLPECEEYQNGKE